VVTPGQFVAWDAAIGVRRTAVLGITLWMTRRSFLWATQYAAATTTDGASTALVIAAVLAPISLLQGYVFKAYLESKE
jgi:hypothetical protein